MELERVDNVIPATNQQPLNLPVFTVSTDVHMTMAEANRIK